VDPDSCAAPRLCGASATCLVPDQLQPDAAFNVTLAGIGVSRFAQIVLPARSGVLSEVVVAVLCFPGTATLELQGVSGGGQPDGQVSFRLDELRMEGDTTRVVIDPPVTVQAGFPFAIVLGGNVGESCTASVAQGDAYPRGAAFIEDPRAPGEWFPFDGDVQFETRVVQ
jgi:hypothetical protein